MKEIYDLCAELYEALADSDDDESKEVVKKINAVLRDIQKSKDES